MRQGWCLFVSRNPITKDSIQTFRCRLNSRSLREDGSGAFQTGAFPCQPTEVLWLPSRDETAADSGEPRRTCTSGEQWMSPISHHIPIEIRTDVMGKEITLEFQSRNFALWAHPSCNDSYLQHYTSSGLVSRLRGTKSLCSSINVWKSTL